MALQGTNVQLIAGEVFVKQGKIKELVSKPIKINATVFGYLVVLGNDSITSEFLKRIVLFVV